MNDFVAASQGDAQNMLGKFLYFSLSNLLVEKVQLSELCESMGISYSGGTRLSVADAFRSATGTSRSASPSRLPARQTFTSSIAGTTSTRRMRSHGNW